MSEREDMLRISNDEKMQSIYGHLVKKHKTTLKKLAINEAEEKL